jgi:hypothetical protein
MYDAQTVISDTKMQNQLLYLVTKGLLRLLLTLYKKECM